MSLALAAEEPVKIVIGHATKDLVEVTAGLKEGERVVLRPSVEFKALRNATLWSCSSEF